MHYFNIQCYQHIYSLSMIHRDEFFYCIHFIFRKLIDRETDRNYSQE